MIEASGRAPTRDLGFEAEPEQHDVCALPLVRRVAALLDQDPGQWRSGMALPRGWEFILFAPATRQSELRPDGHHLPPPTLDDNTEAKVMLGGRRFRFEAPIPIGAAIVRTGEVTAVQRKEGRAGAMTIVTRRYRTILAENGALAVEEDEDMVYRPVTAEPATAAPTPAATVAPRMPAAADSEQSYRPDETMLFRYSALGNNAHRIHYDLEFATRVEGYPALVVNGGLTSLMLVEMFRRHTGREPTSIATRMLRPIFCNSANRIAIAAQGECCRVWAESEAGQIAAESIIS